jgi:flap endonuclease-1
MYRDKDGPVTLADHDGNPTAHLIGLFNRTIAFLECGIKPLWVFDGCPPDMKQEELDKRRDAREEAEAKLADALSVGDTEAAVK